MNLSLSGVTNHCDVSSSCNINTPFVKDVIRGVDPGVLLIGMKGGGGEMKTWIQKTYNFFVHILS